MAIPDDSLSQDVVRDLERVDRVMTQVIADPVTTEEFIRDPSGVLTRLGLHPRTTREIHDRVNRIFYAVLTNTELMRVIADGIGDFAGQGDEADEAFDSALRRGEIEHPLEVDMAALERFLEDPERLRRIFQLCLHDLNDRRLLANVYPTDEIDDYVDRLIEAIRERRGVRDLPVLEEWDERYGVGPAFGALFVEVGPLATAVALVEVGAWTTVIAGVDGDSVIRSISRAGVLTEALRGDPLAARHLATAAAILKLAGEIQVHASNFERH
ncbi:MAG TPA: hypothetical protein VHN37_13995 [Actinomycetota bacterium]|nr:hypothetical protein [Actinomycetota bacterium]